MCFRVLICCICERSVCQPVDGRTASRSQRCSFLPEVWRWRWNTETNLVNIHKYRYIYYKYSQYSYILYHVLFLCFILHFYLIGGIMGKAQFFSAIRLICMVQNGDIPISRGHKLTFMYFLYNQNKFLNYWSLKTCHFNVSRAIGSFSECGISTPKVQWHNYSWYISSFNLTTGIVINVFQFLIVLLSSCSRQSCSSCAADRGGSPRSCGPPASPSIYAHAWRKKEVSTSYIHKF